MPVPAPLWLNSLSGLDRCVPMSTLATGEQLQLQVCEPGPSQVSIYAANLRPSAATSALSPHPVPLFLPPADLALFAPEPLSCLSLAGIKQLNAWADYFRDSLPSVPKDNCHWVWGLWTKPLDPTTVRILAQSIESLREPDWGGGTSSFEIQKACRYRVKDIATELALWWQVAVLIWIFSTLSPHILTLVDNTAICSHVNLLDKKRMEWFGLLCRLEWQLHSASLQTEGNGSLRSIRFQRMVLTGYESQNNPSIHNPPVDVSVFSSIFNPGNVVQ